MKTFWIVLLTGMERGEWYVKRRPSSQKDYMIKISPLKKLPLPTSIPWIKMPSRPQVSRKFALGQLKPSPRVDPPWHYPKVKSCFHTLGKWGVPNAESGIRIAESKKPIQRQKDGGEIGRWTKEETRRRFDCGMWIAECGMEKQKHKSIRARIQMLSSKKTWYSFLMPWRRLLEFWAVGFRFCLRRWGLLFDPLRCWKIWDD